MRRMRRKKTILFDSKNKKTYGKRKNGRNVIYEVEIIPDVQKVRFDFDFDVDGDRGAFVLERFTLSRFVE